MLIRSEMTLPGKADDVFAQLTDIDLVASCIPGVSMQPVDGSKVRRGSVDVKFAMMRFRYSGELWFTSRDERARSAVIEGSGTEAAGEGGVGARVTLLVEPEGERSRVRVETDLRLTGRVAQLGRGLIEDVAEQIVEEFAANLGRRAGADAERTVAGGAETAPAALNSLSMLGKVAKRRVSRLFSPRGKPLPAEDGRTYDVVVVGSGSGALTAAIAAHEAGLSVAIFEKSSRIGGGTAYSGGVVWAPCNAIMKRKGIEDTVENAMLYLDQASGKRGDPVLQEAYIRSVGDVIETVQSWTGIRWIIWTGQPDYYSDLPGALAGRAILQHPASAHEVLSAAELTTPELAHVRLTPHMDFVPGFQTANRPARESWVAGRAIAGGLFKAVVDRKIPFAVSTPAVALDLSAEGVVEGVRVRHPDGREENIRARRGVLLNTGGYDWSDEFAQRFMPGPALVPQTPPSNEGDGHRMAMQAGAAFALMDKALLHPAVHIPGEEHDGKPLYRMFNAELSKPHSMLVNAAGKRFASEAAYFEVCDRWAEIDSRTRQYPNVPTFLVFDDQYRRKYGLPLSNPGDDTSAWTHSAATLEELAARIGVDSAGLAAEVAIFNRDAQTGIDTRFGRGRTEYERFWGDPDHEPNPTMGAIDQAPFFAVKVEPSHAGARGGIVITPDGEATRPDGSVIPGLYACGNTAANLLFGAGYGSGSAVGSSMVFGFRAARRMAASG